MKMRKVLSALLVAVPFHWQHAAVPAARMKPQAHQEKLQQAVPTQQRLSMWT